MPVAPNLSDAAGIYTALVKNDYGWNNSITVAKLWCKFSYVMCTKYTHTHAHTHTYTHTRTHTHTHTHTHTCTHTHTHTHTHSHTHTQGLIIFILFVVLSKQVSNTSNLLIITSWSTNHREQVLRLEIKVLKIAGLPEMIIVMMSWWCYDDVMMMSWCYGDVMVMSW